MADVQIKVRMDDFSKINLAQMTDDAVSRALSRAQANIEKYAREITPVSRLQKKQVGPTRGHIAR